MKKPLLKASIFIVISLVLAGIEITPGSREDILQFYLTDYLAIFLILVGQSLLKHKDTRSFIFYIIGLLFNLVMGYLMNSYSIMLFSLYSIYLFAENWIEWLKNSEPKN